jgi:hypothetical protein
MIDSVHPFTNVTGAARRRMEAGVAIAKFFVMKCSW